MPIRFLSYLHRPYFLTIGILLVFSGNTYGLIDTSQQHEIDSLKTLVQNCNSDTAKFKILYRYFWQFGQTDILRVKHIGEWAYNEIRNSKNLKLLSDGYDIKGCILEKEQKYDSAYPYFLKALAISKKIGYQSRITWSYYHLGLIQKAFGRTDSTLYYFKTLIDYEQKIGFTIEACSMMIETAFLYEEIKMPDSALLYYNKVLAYSRQIKNIEKEIKTYLILAYYYRSQNNTTRQLENLNIALILANKSNNDETIPAIYSQIGDLYFSQKRNYEMALLYYMKAIDKNPTTEYYLSAILFGKIANVYISENNYSLALRYTLKSLAIARSIKHRHQISESYKYLGNIYFHQVELKKAINSFSYCYNMGCDECPKIKFHSALIDIADAYLKLKNPAKALEYYNKSLKLAIDFKSQPEQALSKLKIGNFYRKSDPSVAEKNFREAFILANQTKNIELIRDIADTLTSVYKINQDFVNAFKFKSVSNVMNDSINIIEQQETMANWETRFEFEKVNIENQARELEIKKQKLFRNSALLGSAMLLILGFVVFRNYRRKKKDNKILVEQKRLIEEKNQEILAQVEEITTQKDEIERISNELHQADESKLRFFTNLSHEFRTPLTLIINPAKNLLDTMPLNGDYKKQVEYIYNNAQKLSNLTNQIMDLQKLDAGMLQLNLCNEDIIKYCVGIVSSFESLCDTKKVTIQLDANHSNVFAGFDKDKIGKILVNLLSNAIKFCFENSIIEVKISVTEYCFQLRINDQGLGIPNNEINDVFKRYVQASTNNYAGGTGIGLAYVKELVNFMKGVVTLESIENKGTSVSVEIPVDEIEIKNEDKLHLHVAFRNKTDKIKQFDINEYAEEKPDKAIVQIVEDNDQLREFIAKLFQNEYRVILANNGQEGIETALKNIPDIIISDVMMPLKNGFELCTTLKNDERTSHIPILLLTAKDGMQSSIEGYHTGADDYIIKPFENEILTLKVRNILSTRAAISRQYNAEQNILPNAGAYADIDKNFMKKCLAVVEKNIDNSSFGVDQLAEALAFSSRSFYRKIQSLTNQTPAELIRVYRLQYAKQLLQNTQMRVSEIAGAVGYDDVKRFSQAFKKQFDVLPSELT
jgi:signal transduction histidine kinase/DNA-binding response OmpR family regulator